MKIKCVSWKTVEKLCKKIALQIKQDGFVPDVIVSIARGGVIPSRILCDLLNINEMVVVNVRYYTGIGKTLDQPHFLYLPPKLSYKNILVVDDIADSGKTLELVKSVYPNCKIAVLHTKPTSITKPDYYGEQTRYWIVYPWEANEVKEVQNHETKV